MALEERFEDEQGEFRYYDAYDTAQKFKLPRQKHVDIRDFNPYENRVQIEMVHIDQLSMGAADAFFMIDLEGEILIQSVEEWSVGTVATQPDRNNWAGLTVELAVGTNETQSIIRY